MPDDTPAPPDLAAIRADCATLKPRERASTLTDAQERLLYEAVPALLAEVERLRAAMEHTTRFLATTQYLLDAAGQAQLALACYGARQELTQALQQP